MIIFVYLKPYLVIKPRMSENNIIKKLLIDTGFSLVRFVILLVANINDQEPIYWRIARNPVIAWIFLTIFRYALAVKLEQKEKRKRASTLLPLIVSIFFEFYYTPQVPRDYLALINHLIRFVGGWIGIAFYRYWIGALILENTRKQQEKQK